MRTVYPLVRYRDPDAAIEWLGKAFGFEEHGVSRDEAGVVKHAELTVGTGMVMLGKGDPGGPGIYVAVDDPDAHNDRAVAAGARITMELTDQSYGSREYACEDPEGNIWYFGTYRP
ncbi:VOC family protein [Planobispora siamensis]|uniref:Glyoxalase n=1 Tax=Planobispora siamensis TaxID=936338 RepID=A0A8J3SGS1_9ACTN|nr:VOC family protein [Planobispora siamensis]GIH94057.1 glyoxalase [Planobispora siamensis]